MSHNGADDWILQLGFMEVDDDIHLFFANELGHGITCFFGQCAVGSARPCSVQIPDIHIGQLLSTRVVDVDFGIRPLVERVGPPISHAEFLFSPRSGNREIWRIRSAQPGHCGGASVGRVDHEKLSLLHKRILSEDPCRQAAGGLFRVTPPEDEDSSSGLCSLQDIDV